MLWQVIHPITQLSKVHVTRRFHLCCSLFTPQPLVLSRCHQLDTVVFLRLVILWETVSVPTRWHRDRTYSPVTERLSLYLPGDTETGHTPQSLRDCLWWDSYPLKNPETPGPSLHPHGTAGRGTTAPLRDLSFYSCVDSEQNTNVILSAAWNDGRNKPVSNDFG